MEAGGAGAISVIRELQNDFLVKREFKRFFTVKRETFNFHCELIVNQDLCTMWYLCVPEKI